MSQHIPSRLFPLIHLSCLAILFLSSIITAHSTPRNSLLRLGRIEDPFIKTRNSRINALSRFDLHLSSHGTPLKISLEPNHDVIPYGAVVTYLDHNGMPERIATMDRLRHKVFKGAVLMQDEGREGRPWTRVGEARVMVRKDGARPLFVGRFDVFGDMHNVHLASQYEKTRSPGDPELEPRSASEEDYMVVWRSSDIAPVRNVHEEFKRSASDVQCRGDDLQFNMRPDHPIYADMKMRRDQTLWLSPFESRFGKRQLDGIPGSGNGAGVNLESTIGSTAGCPSTRKVALVGVATDCTYTGTFSDRNETESHIVSVMNSASGVYERTFNISLGLANLTISPGNCPGTPQSTTPWNVPCGNNVDLQDRLNLFSAWRGQQKDDNSHWTLLTNCPTDSAIGLAWLGQACVSNAQTMGTTDGSNETVSGANVVAKTDEEWQVIAHETGHTFGAVHDCTSTTCGDGSVTRQQCCPLNSDTCNAGQRFIMNPSSANGISDFSQCSIGNICAAFDRNSVNTQCFSENRNVPLYTVKQCGNGIVEDDEDCDCGGEEGCGDNSCCDPTTCRFVNDAVCDDSNEDCCNQCQFASSGTVCRESTGDCDPAETCSGNAATCPRDVTKPNGESCGDGLSCASGQCTSRNQQCRSVMGSYISTNNTQACDSYGCMIMCESPDFEGGQCYRLNQYFLDGTSCGNGGRCNNGQCQNADSDVEGWIKRHLGLVIGLAAGIGGFIVLLILGCCIKRCFSRRKMKKQNAMMGPRATGPLYYGGPAPYPTGSNQNMQMHGAAGNFPRPPPMATTRGAGASQGYYNVGGQGDPSSRPFRYG